MTNGDNTASSHNAIVIGFTLWDCTLHPPKDITSWPIHDFPHLQGVKSKTLHTAGMFPTGTWVVCSRGELPRKFLSSSNDDVYVDIQYNTKKKKKKTNDSSNNINTDNDKHKPNSIIETLLPSQVLTSVVNRFQQEKDDEEERINKNVLSDPIFLRKKNLENKKNREQNRAMKLDRKIDILEKQSEEISATGNRKKKKKNISDQVLRMLVKSRATGNKNLKQIDRLYFQCLTFIDNDENDNDTDNDNDNPVLPIQKHYRYFSPQTSFAMIANSFSAPNNNDVYLREVLYRKLANNNNETNDTNDVKKNRTSVVTHLRFPVTMRIYEAISHGYISANDKNKIDTIVIRMYKNKDDATPSISKSIEVADTESNNVSGILALDGEPVMNETKIEAKPDQNILLKAPPVTTFDDPHLSDIIREMDDLNSKGKKAAKKQTSAVAIKLKKMKSKGNKKIKIEDRIYIDVITIISGTAAAPECYFLSKSDPIDRILHDISKLKSASSSARVTDDDWSFLVPQKHNSNGFHEITVTSMSTQEAIEKGIFGVQSLLLPFNRLILRRKNLR